jgi:6-pyruvoyltetrahydropterin/6-carboxytetrahydropterin synthase
MTYYSTKTYDHNEGLSCAFRQWRAKDSHCRWIHGYALAVKFTFGCKELEDLDLVDLRIMPAVGCEKFAEYIYNHVSKIVDEDRKWLESVEVREHGANSAIYKRS